MEVVAHHSHPRQLNGAPPDLRRSSPASVLHLNSEHQSPEIKECQYKGHAKCKLDNDGVTNRSLGHEDTKYLEMIYSGAVY
ncbi:hypothetical protein EJB05_33684 [Eragrostis curvula]|uniref:Uncharacterized protein n=1 Tax=Eragrostis curvula TaxID=38414 RepID=A0A5J9U1W0_9POAL|nr:hypothetical protein EJB05_33684 [Eragrostis curvula]